MMQCSSVLLIILIAYSSYSLGVEIGYKNWTRLYVGPREDLTVVCTGEDEVTWEIESSISSQRRRSDEFVDRNRDGREGRRNQPYRRPDHQEEDELPEDLAVLQNLNAQIAELMRQAQDISNRYYGNLESERNRNPQQANLANDSSNAPIANSDGSRVGRHGGVSRFRENCFNCSSPNHTQAHCRYLDRGPRCFECKKWGHLGRDCRYRNRNQSSQRRARGNLPEFRPPRFSGAYVPGKERCAPRVDAATSPIHTPMTSITPMAPIIDPLKPLPKNLEAEVNQDWEELRKMKKRVEWEEERLKAKLRIYELETKGPEVTPPRVEPFVPPPGIQLSSRVPNLQPPPGLGGPFRPMIPAAVLRSGAQSLGLPVFPSPASVAQSAASTSGSSSGISSSTRRAVNVRPPPPPHNQELLERMRAFRISVRNIDAGTPMQIDDNTPMNETPTNTKTASQTSDNTSTKDDQSASTRSQSRSKSSNRRSLNADEVLQPTGRSPDKTVASKIVKKNTPKKSPPKSKSPKSSPKRSGIINDPLKSAYEPREQAKTPSVKDKKNLGPPKRDYRTPMKNRSKNFSTPKGEIVIEYGPGARIPTKPLQLDKYTPKPVQPPAPQGEEEVWDFESGPQPGPEDQPEPFQSILFDHLLDLYERQVDRIIEHRDERFHLEGPEDEGFVEFDVDYRAYMALLNPVMEAARRASGANGLPRLTDQILALELLLELCMRWQVPIVGNLQHCLETLEREKFRNTHSRSQIATERRRRRRARRSALRRAALQARNVDFDSGLETSDDSGDDLPPPPPPRDPPPPPPPASGACAIAAN